MEDRCDGQPLSTGPLLTDGAYERAWETILAVAETLEPSEEDTDTSSSNPSLSAGDAGLVLFFSYLAVAQDDERWSNAAMLLFDRTLDGLASTPLRPSLYGGFLGIGWLSQHLDGRLFEEEEDDSLEDIDAALLQAIDAGPWPGDYDLINGLAGFGVYAMEGLRRPAARQILDKVLVRLDELAVDQAPGTTWHTRPELLVEHQRQHSPAGYYNLGLAHGMPAVIALLAGARAAGASVEATRCLEPAVDWLLAQQLPAGAGSCFPTWIGTDASRPATKASRLAWCYGDPGVAAALASAARSVGRKDWAAEALRIARQAAHRRDDESGIKDAGLCHGAAGLGHLFHRLARTSGDQELAAAARHWLIEALDMRQEDSGLAGYLAWSTDLESGEPILVPERGFLTGAAGVALALLAAVTTLEPDWDRLLMISSKQ